MSTHNNVKGHVLYEVKDNYSETERRRQENAILRAAIRLVIDQSRAAAEAFAGALDNLEKLIEC